MSCKQVSRGGDAQINWKILDPKGRELISQERISAADHEFDVKDGGDYKICLDNSFSSEYKVVTLVVDHQTPDEMTVLFDKLARTQDNSEGSNNLVVCIHLFQKLSVLLFVDNSLVAGQNQFTIFP